MDTHTINLTQLHPHPHNSNVMSEAMLRKLASHIERTDHYPPIIVRPITPATPTDPATYQILDGHHRVEALRRLDQPHARCVVWQVDEAEALRLLATLNRLEGQDDPQKRAKLLTALSRRTSLETLADQLPEPREKLRKLIELDRPVPPPRPPQALQDMPQAVHFFLQPEQRRQLNRVLKEIDGSREQALMTLVDRHG